MEEKLKSVVERAVPGVDVSKITRETKLVDDLGFDSLALMMLAMGIEDSFGYRFNEFVRFDTFGEVCDYLAERV
ncbi:MAG: acyl carrier protein [Clostridia bacterium]|nr:acyl carrier protein [Clostridia bacterium]